MNIHAVVHAQLARLAGEWEVLPAAFPPVEPGELHRRYASLRAAERALGVAGYRPSSADSITVAFTAEHDRVNAVQYTGPAGAGAVLVRIRPAGS